MVFDLTGSGSASRGADQDIIKDGSTATFAQDVIAGSQKVPIVVDFWASWCGPCKQLTPLLEKVVRSYNGAVRLIKIDTDKHQDLAGQLRIQSLPTIYAFKDGRPVDGFTGALPESEIRAFIDKVVGDGAGGGDLEAYLEAANAALEAGDMQGAAELFAAILQDDKENADALAGLAQCYLNMGDIERAKQTIGFVGPEGASNASVARVEAALALAQKAEKAGPTGELEQKVASAPDDHQARFDLAVALAAAGKKGGAVSHLLEIIKRERAWNDEAARKQLVEFFDAWGPKDSATIDGRRQLSAILFA